MRSISGRTICIRILEHEKHIRYSVGIRILEHEKHIRYSVCIRILEHEKHITKYGLYLDTGT